MFLTKKILQRQSSIVFESSTPGTYTKTLSPGWYEITMIGAGGGGVCAYTQRAGSSWASGGVGCTSKIKTLLSGRQLALSITIGAGGSSSSAMTPTSITGTAGGDTTITTSTFSLNCGGGTSGSITGYQSGGTYYKTPVAGTYGVFSYTGISADDILFNGNDYPIVSQTGTSRIQYTLNTNFPTDTSLGQGGWASAGNNVTPGVGYRGGNGYVLIKKL